MYMYTYCTSGVYLQEEAEVPDDEQLNDMIARNEDEMELFTVSATRHSVHVQCTRACTK